MHYCLNCGIELKKHQNKFCSNKCQFKLKEKSYIEKWKSGFESGLKGKDGLSPYIRKYIFNKYDSKCSICGWSEINKTTGKIPLEVEHIDGDYKNNKEDNLTLLCPNCHSLTSTYKSLNTGKGRRARYNNEPLKIKIEPIKNFCKDCGMSITKYSKQGRCNSCAQKQRRVSERPGPYILALDIVKLGFSKTGLKYNVSDNAIRRWCKSYGMPIKKEELVIWLEKNRQHI